LDLEGRELKSELKELNKRLESSSEELKKAYSNEDKLKE
jgi:hypothetical protein